MPLQLSDGHHQNSVSASRFLPAIVLCPMTDALETVTMQVRSCFVVEAHVPIELQIVVVQGQGNDGRGEDFGRSRGKKVRMRNTRVGVRSEATKRCEYLRDITGHGAI